MEELGLQYAAMPAEHDLLGIEENLLRRPKKRKAFSPTRQLSGGNNVSLAMNTQLYATNRLRFSDSMKTPVPVGPPDYMEAGTENTVFLSAAVLTSEQDKRLNDNTEINKNDSNPTDNVIVFIAQGKNKKVKRENEAIIEPDVKENTITYMECMELGVQLRCQGQMSSNNNVVIQPQDKTVLNYQKSHERVLKPRKPSQFCKPGKVIFGTDQACMQLVDSVFLPSEITGVIVDNSLRPSQDCQYSEGHELTHMTVIGAGSYGEVYLCEDKTTHKEFVVKKIKKEKYRKTEVKVLLQLEHDNIVKFYGLVHRHDEVEIYMENCGCSLKDFASEPETRKLLREKLVWDFTIQGLKALKYLADKKIIHFDIKPDNVCIKHIDTSYQLKITDFGSAVTIQDGKMLEGFTVEYMSTEACRMILKTCHPNLNLKPLEGDYSVSCQTDGFSWGLTVLYMILKISVMVQLITKGKESYDGLDKTEVDKMRRNLILQIANNPGLVREHLIPILQNVENQHLKELLQGLLEECPEKRWSPDRSLQRVEDMNTGTLPFGQCEKVYKTAKHRHDMETTCLSTTASLSTKSTVKSTTTESAIKSPTSATTSTAFLTSATTISLSANMCPSPVSVSVSTMSIL